MITQEKQPVEWAMLVYEAADAHEHLGVLIDQLVSAGEVDEEDLRVQLGHVYAHLNRFWHARNLTGDRTQDEMAEHSTFPDDVPPVG